MSPSMTLDPQRFFYAAPALPSQPSNHMRPEKAEKTPYIASLGRNLYDAIEYVDPVTKDFAISTPSELLKQRVGDWDDVSRSKKERQASLLKANEIIKSFDQNGNHQIDGAQLYMNRRAVHSVSELTKPGSELEKLYEYLIPKD